MNHPLLPLAPCQRLAWLRHFSSIRCRKDHPPSFTKSRDYPITVESIRVTHPERRAVRSTGARATITLAGHSLLVTLRADNGWRHRFLDCAPATSHPLLHSLQFLVEHFVIPPIPDVVALNPKAFDTYKARLRALES